MWFDPNPYALANLVPILAGGTLAVLVARNRPLTPEKRRVASVFGISAILCVGMSIAFGATDYSLAAAGYTLVFAAWGSLLPASLRLAAMFPSPLGAWLRHAWIDRGLVAFVFLAPLAWIFFMRDLTINGLSASTFTPWRANQLPVGYDTYAYTTIVVGLFGVVVVADAWRRTPVGPTRSRLAGYLIGLGAYELASTTLQIVRMDLINARAAGLNPRLWEIQVSLHGAAITVTSLSLVLGYAVLKSNVFSFDLKIKWTLRRGTLVGAFLAVFVIVAAVIEQWLQQYGVLLGGVAVGFMLLALRPIERAADRLADKAMPNVDDTPAYASFRKLEVYKAAVEELAVGGVTEKERRALDALRAKLGIALADANAMERNTVGASVA